MKSNSLEILEETQRTNLQSNQEISKSDENIDSKNDKINLKINENKEFENNKTNSEIENAQKKLNNLLFNIKSRFLLKDLLMNYISRKKKLYLFQHSKSLQNKLNITIQDYQETYLDNIFPLSKINELINKKYISFNYEKEKDERNKLYNTFFDEIKCDKNVIEAYIIKKIKEDNKKYGVFKSFCYDIDINNPFFDSFIKKDIIEEYQIFIDENSFVNNNLLNDIIKTFEKLNNENYIFPQIAMQLPFNSLNNINKLNINFKKVKKLLINYLLINPNADHTDYGREYFEKIYSFFQETNNLEQIMINMMNPINFESLKILSSFTNLKILSLMNVNSNDGKFFKIKLPNLNKLSLSCCKFITFDESKVYNIEILIIINSIIIKPKSLLTFPHLRYLINNSSEIIPFLDLTKSKNLKTLSANLSEVSNVLDNLPTLQNLSIEESKENKSKNEEEALNKIFDNKNLKFIKLAVQLNDERIIRRNKANLSVTKISFQNLDNILNNFLNKFHNLNEFEFSKYDKTEDNIFEIKEDSTSKINKIKLYGVPNGILYCHSFESLKVLNFEFRNKVKNIEKILPLFANNCTVIFRTLSDFSLTYNDINEDFLNILKNNIDCAPYLSSFTLKFNFSNINENIYYDFIKKILSKRINNIKINNQYDSNMTLTKDELKKISPNFNFIYHDNIKISKFK